MIDTDQLLISQFFKEHEDLAVKHIEGLDLNVIVELVENLSLEQARILLVKMSAFKASRALEKVQIKRAASLINSLAPLTIQSLLRMINKSVRDHILNELSPEQGAYLRKSLDYPKDRVGAHIEPLVMTLAGRMSIENSLKLINEGGAKVQPHIFVINDRKKLTGFVELNDLLQGDKPLQIKSIQHQIKRAALADMSINDLLDRWDDALVNMPVVDVEGVFIGSVSKVVLSELSQGFRNRKQVDDAAIKAGNALGELYLIGLSGLLGSHSESDNTN